MMEFGDVDGVNIDEVKTNLSTYKEHLEQVCTYNLRSCSKRRARKRQQTNSTSSSIRYYLPQEIVFLFLLHLPAHILFNVTRHVCREWSLVIRSPKFARQHLRNSTTAGAGGLLIQTWSHPWRGFYLELRRGCIEICDFKCTFHWLVLSSCNGLVLISDTDKDGHLVDYVTNPLTKQLTVIPHFGGLISSCGLAYVDDDGFFKVVRAQFTVPPLIQVLTIGVDEVWRDIGITHLLLVEEQDFYGLLVVSGGYAHWTAGGFVLTLNVGTEIVYRFSRPSSRGDFLPMGGNLSFVSSTTKYVREVWEMNSENGE